MAKEYNDQGNLISETCPNGEKITYEYDDKGSRVSTTFPDGEKITYFKNNLLKK